MRDSLNLLSRDRGQYDAHVLPVFIMCYGFQLFLFRQGIQIGSGDLLLEIVYDVGWVQPIQGAVVRGIVCCYNAPLRLLPQGGLSYRGHAYRVCKGVGPKFLRGRADFYPMRFFPGSRGVRALRMSSL